MRTFFIVILCLFCLTCSRKSDVIPEKSELSSNKNWTVFRGDVGLSGCAKAELPANPTLIWRFKTGDKITSSPIVSSNVVYIGSQDKNFYALDLNSGNELWHAVLDDSIEAPAIFMGGSLFVSSLQGTVYAYSEKGKTLLWKRSLPGKVMASANAFDISPDLPALLVSCYDDFLYCLDRRNGKIIWTYETKNFINGTPAVATGIKGKERIVFGGCDSFIHVISPLTGRKYATFSLGSYVAGSTTTYKQLAVLGNYKGVLTCYDFINERLVWKYGDPENGDPFFSSAAINSNMVIIGSRDKNVHAIDLATGKRKWIFRTGKNVDSSPVICGDKVIACSEDGYIYIIDINSGKEIWSYQIGAKITGSPAVADNKILIGALDGTIYCFGGTQ